MAAYLNHWFEEKVQEMPPNASIVGFHLKADKSGEPDSLDFQWDFPYIEEDIWLDHRYRDDKRFMEQVEKSLEKGGGSSPAGGE